MVNRVISAISILLMFAAVGATEQNESEIIEEIQDVYDNIEYFSAEFVQKEKFTLTESVNETAGKIFIKNGTEYKLETDDHIIITDGKSVWSYSIHSNQVVIDFVKEGDASVLPRDMLFKYPQNYYSTLLNTEKINNDKYYVLKMVPKEDTQGYIKSMKIWVNSNTYLINKLEYVDLNENTSSFEINKLDVKTKLPDDMFEFITPQGAEIIDMRQ